MGGDVGCGGANGWTGLRFNFPRLLPYLRHFAASFSFIPSVGLWLFLGSYYYCLMSFIYIYSVCCSNPQVLSCPRGVTILFSFHQNTQLVYFMYIFVVLNDNIFRRKDHSSSSDSRVELSLGMMRCRVFQWVANAKIPACNLWIPALRDSEHAFPLPDAIVNPPSLIGNCDSKYYGSLVFWNVPTYYIIIKK